MVGRARLAQTVAEAATRVFPRTRRYGMEVARLLWQRVLKNPLMLDAVLEDGAHSRPLEEISVTRKIDPIFDGYTAVGVDGSQVYADQTADSVPCVLINIGGIILKYGGTSSATLFSEPKVIVPEDCSGIPGGRHLSHEFVDFLREQRELEQAFEKSKRELRDCRGVCFLDGTLIFGFLAEKPPMVAKYFLGKYMEALSKFCDHGIPHVAYISSSRSRDIVRLLESLVESEMMPDEIGAEELSSEAWRLYNFDYVFDVDVLTSSLPCFHRTAWFESRAPIIVGKPGYPEPLRVAFCYVNVGAEIVRLEIPMWLFKSTMCKEVLGMTLDQALKGHGYPVAISESHEQAVVRGADRDFFVSLLEQHGIGLGVNSSMSQKAFKKRIVAV
jgi:hypothetical protein